MDLRLGQDARARPWFYDAVLGGLAALGAITLAHAALPDAPRPAPVEVAAAPVADPPPEEEAVLIAFHEPVPGRAVVSPFGLRRLPWEDGGRLHAGVDIQGNHGEAVRAAADGVVTEAGHSPSYGRYVVLKHAEGLTTFYAHLGRLADHLRPGQALKAGEALGRVGSSGASTGPHLHFEIRDRRDRPLNPTFFLGRTFASAEELPVRKAQRFGRTVRIAQVSNIPRSKRALMQAKFERQEGADALDLAGRDGEAASSVATEAAGAGRNAAAVERFEGLKVLPLGGDGRPRGQISS